MILFYCLILFGTNTVAALATHFRAWFRKSRCSRDQLHMRFIIMALGTGCLYLPYAESLKQRPTDNVPSELCNLIWSRRSNYRGCYLCHENMIHLASHISISPCYLHTLVYYYYSNYFYLSDFSGDFPVFLKISPV